jgi:hypothetical protein
MREENARRKDKYAIECSAWDYAKECRMELCSEEKIGNLKKEIRLKHTKTDALF